MTRDEHLEWCKQRARQYVEIGDLPQAVASMISDLGKHDDTANTSYQALAMIGMVDAASGDRGRVVRWIDRFN